MPAAESVAGTFLSGLAVARRPILAKAIAAQQVLGRSHLFGNARVGTPVNIVGYADLPQGWDWIVSMYDGDPAIDWRMASSLKTAAERKIPGLNLGRVRSAFQLRAMMRAHRPDLVVSVSPNNSFYAEAFALPRFQDVPHLAWGFNFTDLPTGFRLDAMRRRFDRVERFAVFSEMERTLYSRLFDLPIDRFAFTRWAVSAPIDHPLPRTIAGPYFVALGGEARDYVTLCDAARRLPGLSFALVARPHSLVGVDVPDNVTVHLDLPWVEAWSLVWHAEASLVPLRSRETPNGHVTVVGGMHLGKAQIVTDSLGIRDYVTDGQTALLVAPNDASSLSRAIERLADDVDLRDRLGRNGKVFARDHCSEQVTVDFALDQLRRLANA